MNALVMLGVGAAALGVLAIARGNEKKKPATGPMPGGGTVPPPVGPVAPGPTPVVFPGGGTGTLPGPAGGGTGTLPGPAGGGTGTLPGPAGGGTGTLPGPAGGGGVTVAPLTFKKPLNADGTYTVVPGDYGTAIAKKLNPSDTYGASWKELRPLNPKVMGRPDPSKSGFPLQIGDVLAVPDSWKALWISTGTLPGPTGGTGGNTGTGGGGLPGPAPAKPPEIEFPWGPGPLPIAVIDPNVGGPETSPGWFW